MANIKRRYRRMFKAICISDTHSKHSLLTSSIEEIIQNECITFIIHAGDFSNYSFAHTDDFLNWYASLDIPIKILVAGNHDWYVKNYNEAFKARCHLLGIHYLEDEAITLNGIKFYGTPYVNRFYNWAFMENEEGLKKVYKKIPLDTDVLVSHGPAYGVLDKVVREDLNVGSTSLRDRLAKMRRLQYHIFGHIHESAGTLPSTDKSKYISANVSALYHTYQLRVEKPLVIEIKALV